MPAAMVRWEINISNIKVCESKAGGGAGVLKAAFRTTCLPNNQPQPENP